MIETVTKVAVIDLPHTYFNSWNQKDYVENSPFVEYFLERPSGTIPVAHELNQMGQALASSDPDVQGSAWFNFGANALTTAATLKVNLLGRPMRTAAVADEELGVSSANGVLGESGAAPALALRLRIRQLELGYNPETKLPNLAEGLGGARYEQFVGRSITRSAVDGADLVDPAIGPISLKGPLGIRGATGLPIPITPQMIDGLADSVVEDVTMNVYTKRVVVDTLRLSPEQRAYVIRRIQAGIPIGGKQVFILY
jgi:hypothetical protein